MKSNRTTRLVVLVLFLAIVTAVIISGTFAKYTSSLEGEGTATVANWSFAVTGWTEEGPNTVSLADTTLNGKVTDGKIAPGTDGSFNVAIDASGSDVAVDYTITISNLQNVPTNLKFYSDSTFSNELTATDGKYTFTGSIALAAVETPVNAPVYWQWAYETTDGDAADTAEGIAAETMTFDISVVGTQANPTVAN